MRFQISFKDHDGQSPESGTSRLMPLERFIEFLREGKFGDVVEVKFELEPQSTDATKPRRYFYTVVADDVDIDDLQDFLNL